MAERADAPTEQQWWEDDGLPWNGKPTKADYWCPVSYTHLTLPTICSV